MTYIPASQDLYTWCTEMQYIVVMHIYSHSQRSCNKNSCLLNFHSKSNFTVALFIFSNLFSAGDVVGTVGDSVDNQWVKAGADVAKEQLQADKDTSISQRVMLGVGTGMGGVGEAIGNPIASG